MAMVFFIFIIYFLAWWTALSFIHCTRKEVFFHSFFASAIATLIEFVFQIGMIQYKHEVLSLLFFLMYLLVIQIQTNCGYGNTLIVLFVGKGAEALLYGVYLLARDTIVISLATENEYIMTLPIYVSLSGCVIFVILLWKCIHLFPEKDWRNYFDNVTDGEKKYKFSDKHVYVILGTVFLLFQIGDWAFQNSEISISAVCIIVILGFVLFWGSVWFVILLIDYQRENIAILAEKQYRNEMQSFMNVIRSQRHDYNFHVQTLAGMIHSGNMKECEKYIDELVQDSIAMNMVLPIKDPAISAMINNFRMLAAREGIELHMDIQNDLSHVITNVYETNKIISNLLQNAIDETRTHQDKSYGIWLYILKRGEFVVIHVANELKTTASNAEYVRDIYEQGYSTKQGHEGVGLSSIRNLAERYRGVIYTRMEDNIIHFIAKIPIRYEANKEDPFVMNENNEQ